MVDSSSSIVDCTLCDDVTIDRYIIVSTLLTTMIMSISIYMCCQCVFTAMMMTMIMMVDDDDDDNDNN